MKIICCDKCGKKVKDDNDLSYVSLHTLKNGVIPVDLCCDCMSEIEIEREKVRVEVDTKFYASFKYKEK